MDEKQKQQIRDELRKRFNAATWMMKDAGDYCYLPSADTRPIEQVEDPRMPEGWK